MQFKTILFGLSMIAALVAGGSVHAQTQRSGGGEAQKFMQQYQQLAAEHAAMQAQLADLKKQLDAAKADKAELAVVKKERDAAKASVGAAAATLSQAEKTKSAAEQSLEQSKQRMNELVARFRETLQNMKEIESDRNDSRKQLAERSTAYGQCVEDNLQLYKLSREVLDRYEHVGLFTKISASEPFTRITRTRIENFAEEYRIKADALKLEAPKSKEHTP